MPSRKVSRKSRRHRSKHQNAKSFEDRIISYHSRFGFKNQRDFEECINIHFALLSCSLVKECQPQLDQHIIKEIAVFATGLCIDCNDCKSNNCALYGTTLDDDALINLCKTYNYNSSHAWKSTETKLEYSKSMLLSFNKYDKIGYIGYDNDRNDEIYICSDCLPNKLTMAPFCDQCECPAISEHVSCQMTKEYIDRSRWQSREFETLCQDDYEHHVAMETYNFVTGFTKKEEAVYMKCDQYLTKLKNRKKANNSVSFNNIGYVSKTVRYLKECEACKGQGTVYSKKTNPCWGREEEFGDPGSWMCKYCKVLDQCYLKERYVPGVKIGKRADFNGHSVMVVTTKDFIYFLCPG